MTALKALPSEIHFKENLASPVPFPSENFGGHGKKVLRKTADAPSLKLPPPRKATARRDGVRGDAMSRIQSKTEKEVQATCLRDTSA
jgi:hypothetical protein